MFVNASGHRQRTGQPRNLCALYVRHSTFGQRSQGWRIGGMEAALTCRRVAEVWGEGTVVWVWVCVVCVVCVRESSRDEPA